MTHSTRARPTRLGMFILSSNTLLEPITAAMRASAPSVTSHFSRFPVTKIALSCAAEFLAHAKVDVIAWNGTSASWIGFDADERLCERGTSATRVPACTTIPAYRALSQRTGNCPG